MIILVVNTKNRQALEDPPSRPPFRFND